MVLTVVVLSVEAFCFERRFTSLRLEHNALVNKNKSKKTKFTHFMFPKNMNVELLVIILLTYRCF